MNTKNNQRRRTSIQKIERAFIQLLQTKNVDEITVTDLCKLAQLNRSTFYANYIDVYDLVEKLEMKMMEDFQTLYADEEANGYNSNDFLKLFYHIRENQLFYNTYFKLNFDLNVQITNYDKALAEKYYDLENIEYHMEFFRAGITAVIKRWLKGGCVLSPEEVFEIIKSEYRK
ncbi:TetR-like C-terminal domain-containing protein [Clostridium sp. AM58-1XD]|uniref:TetR/AcrR family transcriptional regulator n=1 Tax=Clostridium sp. AM58-1XD TaxID=2292307 RepID=UPI000E53E947|nr:TetR-like C-terminal domain-containing protein [Clostridium sp. AM58-1XD]RGY99465.1 TetR/AcrR family transcriptional regulator [Clostridium sp. AM58-1XD]